MGTIVLKAQKQKVGLTKKLAYVTRAVRYSTIDKDQLVEHASADTGVNEAQLVAGHKALMQEIRQLVLNGHSVQLGDMGTLQFSIRCKTVENKEDLSTDLVKARRIVFHPSARLRDELKRVKFETVVADDDESDGGDGE